MENLLSKRLRDLREDADLKQSDIAEALQISQSKISYFENGRQRPSYDEIARYAEYFNAPVEYLIGVSNERYRTSRKEDTAMEAMQAAAVTAGDRPFSRADVAKLAVAFSAYYKAGAPAGNAPMQCVTDFLQAMRGVLHAAAQHDDAAIFPACDDVARAGLDVTAILRNYMGVSAAEKEEVEGNP